MLQPEPVQYKIHPGKLQYDTVRTSPVYDTARDSPIWYSQNQSSIWYLQGNSNMIPSEPFQYIIPPGTVQYDTARTSPVKDTSREVQYDTARTSPVPIRYLQGKSSMTARTSPISYELLTLFFTILLSSKVLVFMIIPLPPFYSVDIYLSRPIYPAMCKAKLLLGFQPTNCY